MVYVQMALFNHNLHFLHQKFRWPVHERYPRHQWKPDFSRTRPKHHFHEICSWEEAPTSTVVERTHFHLKPPFFTLEDYFALLLSESSSLPLVFANTQKHCPSLWMIRCTAHLEKEIKEKPGMHIFRLPITILKALTSSPESWAKNSNPPFFGSKTSLLPQPNIVKHNTKGMHHTLKTAQTIAISIFAILSVRVPFWRMCL